MFGRLWKLACVSLLLLAGCTTLAPPPGPPQVPPRTGAAEPRESWARVLQRYVDGEGRVDFAGLSRDRADLDRYVAWIYTTGPDNHPELFPTLQHVLAYHLNAYNALAMYAVLDDGIPQSLAGLKKISFFLLKRFQIGGGHYSLYAYENDVIRALGEPRVHFALNCMSVSCPRLPREPFSGEQLEAQLEQETRHFFSQSSNVLVDNADRTVYFSEILDFYPKDFLAAAPTLIAYANRYRTTPVPEDYTVKFIPYDWTINRPPALP